MGEGLYKAADQLWVHWREVGGTGNGVLEQSAWQEVSLFGCVKYIGLEANVVSTAGHEASSPLQRTARQLCDEVANYQVPRKPNTVREAIKTLP